MLDIKHIIYLNLTINYLKLSMLFPPSHNSLQIIRVSHITACSYVIVYSACS